MDQQVNNRVIGHTSSVANGRQQERCAPASFPVTGVSNRSLTSEREPGRVSYGALSASEIDNKTPWGEPLGASGGTPSSLNLFQGSFGLQYSPLSTSSPLSPSSTPFNFSCDTSADGSSAAMQHIERQLSVFNECGWVPPIQTIGRTTQAVVIPEGVGKLPMTPTPRQAMAPFNLPGAKAHIKYLAELAGEARAVNTPREVKRSERGAGD